MCVYNSEQKAKYQMLWSLHWQRTGQQSWKDWLGVCKYLLVQQDWNKMKWERVVGDEVGWSMQSLVRVLEGLWQVWVRWTMVVLSKKWHDLTLAATRRKSRRKSCC
jgi:hypothetical protein